jgi:hypothetical protein
MKRIHCGVSCLKILKLKEDSLLGCIGRLRKIRTFRPLPHKIYGFIWVFFIIIIIIIIVYSYFIKHTYSNRYDKDHLKIKSFGIQCNNKITNQKSEPDTTYTPLVQI